MLQQTKKKRIKTFSDLMPLMCKAADQSSRFFLTFMSHLKNMDYSICQKKNEDIHVSALDTKC